MLRGDGSMNERASRRSSRKTAAKITPEPQVANMEVPCLRAASPAASTSLMDRRAAVGRSLQGASKPERATKRQKLIETNQLPRFPGQTFLEQAAISGQVAQDYANRVAQFAKAVKIPRHSYSGHAEVGRVLEHISQQHVLGRHRHFRRKQDFCRRVGRKARLFPSGTAAEVGEDA